jgi:cation diffusion facilitator CzcD-associated flavoprotein CzcO
VDVAVIGAGAAGIGISAQPGEQRPFRCGA